MGMYVYRESRQICPWLLRAEESLHVIPSVLWEQPKGNGENSGERGAEEKASGLWG